VLTAPPCWGERRRRDGVTRTRDAVKPHRCAHSHLFPDNRCNCRSDCRAGQPSNPLAKSGADLAPVAFVGPEPPAPGAAHLAFPRAGTPPPPGDGAGLSQGLTRARCSSRDTLSACAAAGCRGSMVLAARLAASAGAGSTAHGRCARLPARAARTPRRRLAVAASQAGPPEGPRGRARSMSRVEVLMRETPVLDSECAGPVCRRHVAWGSVASLRAPCSTLCDTRQGCAPRPPEPVPAAGAPTDFRAGSAASRARWPRGDHHVGRAARPSPVAPPCVRRLQGLSTGTCCWEMWWWCWQRRQPLTG